MGCKASIILKYRLFGGIDKNEFLIGWEGIAPEYFQEIFGSAEKTVWGMGADTLLPTGRNN
jgi:hypothetical protein